MLFVKGLNKSKLCFYNKDYLHILIRLKSKTSEDQNFLLQQGNQKLHRTLLQSKIMEKSQMKNNKQQFKSKNMIQPPGRVSLHVLGAGNNGAPMAVYLFTDKNRYMFNCGEGLQRLATEFKVKITRLEKIFLTRNTWTAIGGLPGLLLTVQDAGILNLSLYGPPLLNQIITSMKSFVIMKTLQIRTIDCCVGERNFEDDVISVEAIPLYRNKYSHEIFESLRKNIQDNVMYSAKKQGKLYLADRENVTIAYICQLKPKLAALNLEKCVQLGVPPGPLLGQLKNGFDITLANGKIVKSSDVSEISEKPLKFLVIDVPDEDFLSSLQSQEEKFVQFSKNNEKNDTEISIVIHFTPMEIIESDYYQEFIRKISHVSNTQHFYVNGSSKQFSGYVSTHRIQYKLNQLNPAIFPLLAEASQEKKIIKDYKDSIKLNGKIDCNKSNDKSTNPKNIASDFINNLDITTTPILNSMTSYCLRPGKGLDRTLEQEINPELFICEAQQLANFTKFQEDLHLNYEKIGVSFNRTSLYPQITFLGTGSSVPNKTRNVSAILLQPHKDTYILLDCGEGTLGQFIRFFGSERTHEILSKLKIIYISHMHADHHIGIMALLSERLKIPSLEKLLLFAPKQIEPWLDYYNTYIQDLKSNYTLISNGNIMDKPLIFASNDNHYDCINGVNNIQTCLVRHCAHAFGVTFLLTNLDEQSKPMKITYSGDTMPCEDLIKLGFDSTILIHEATMEDDLIEEAILKSHSTLSQAIEQGQAMQAKHIILTHFSQRYAKLPRLPCQPETGKIMPHMQNVAIAFDNMQVTLDDLKHFHLLYPAMGCLFAEYADQLDQRAIKRELKLKRKRKIMDL